MGAPVVAVALAATAYLAAAFCDRVAGAVCGVALSGRVIAAYQAAVGLAAQPADDCLAARPVVEFLVVGVALVAAVVLVATFGVQVVGVERLARIAGASRARQSRQAQPGAPFASFAAFFPSHLWSDLCRKVQKTVPRVARKKRCKRGKWRIFSSPSEA
jgi:hypothetical protein